MRNSSTSALVQQIRAPGSSVRRRQAASELAQRKDGVGWTVLFLTDRVSLNDAKVLSLSTDPMVESFDRAVVAGILDNLPNDVDDSILWAITINLTDNDVGRYSYTRTTTFGLVNEKIQAHTESIQSLARNALVRLMKVDHGLDQEAWRQEISSRHRP